MIQFSLVEVYNNKLLETTSMNEVQCRNLKYRNVKNKECKNWKENKVDKIDFLIQVSTLHSGAFFAIYKSQ